MTKRREGPLTDRIRRAVPHWHDAQDISDEALAKKIRDDGIDILIDSTVIRRITGWGFLPVNPLLYKSAGLAIPATMDLSAMDYVIGDRFVLPETMQHLRVPKFFIYRVLFVSIHRRTHRQSRPYPPLYRRDHVRMLSQSGQMRRGCYRLMGGYFEPSAEIADAIQIQGL